MILVSNQSDQTIKTMYPPRSTALCWCTRDSGLSFPACHSITFIKLLSLVALDSSQRHSLSSKSFSGNLVGTRWNGPDLEFARSLNVIYLVWYSLRNIGTCPTRPSHSSLLVVPPPPRTMQRSPRRAKERKRGSQKKLQKWPMEHVQHRGKERKLEFLPSPNIIKPCYLLASRPKRTESTTLLSCH